MTVNPFVDGLDLAIPKVRFNGEKPNIMATTESMAYFGLNTIQNKQISTLIISRKG